MAGDISNPRFWVNADVYVANVGTTAPTDVSAAWGAGWDNVGLLTEDGMTESRNEDVADHYAYGGILIRTTRAKHKRTLAFGALEENDVVFGLVNPGSTRGAPASGVVTATIKVPGPNPKAFGLELRDGPIIKRRFIPKGEVVAVADTTISDNAPVSFGLTVNIYPASDGTLYYDVSNDPQAA